ncbi:MAG TPA: hypothetical protein VF039_11290 [Longimicrobiales bacterium]
MHHRSVGKGWLLVLGALALGACERELPTEVGAEHVPEAALRTYEIVLGDDVFLLGDTLVRGFGSSDLATLLVVAQDWRDTIDAHGLVKLRAFPRTLTFADSGNIVTDTVLRYVAGRLVLQLDTVSLGLDTLGTDTTITFEIYQIAEPFDARTASWRARESVGADSVFWTTPGGTTGDLIATASWMRSDTMQRDTVSFVIDSATVARWDAGGDDERAFLIRTTTAGARVHLGIPTLRLDARMEEDPDTIRTLSSAVEAQTYVYDPAPPAPVDELRLGDRSAWRSYITFAPGLDSLEVPCPNEPGCTFRLGDAMLNRADLVLTPLAVPEAWRLTFPIEVEVRAVLGGADRPLERAPLADTTGLAVVVPADFEVEGDSITRLGVTRFVRGLLGGAADSTITDRDRTIALVSDPEPVAYGIASFGGIGHERAPLLRLIVTLPVREEND